MLNAATIFSRPCMTFIFNILNHRLVRYVISGGTSTATNLGSFFVLVHFGHVYYLTASVMAFVLSMIVSFTMQKFWTFGHRTIRRMHFQFGLYILVALGNLALNTALVYGLVEWAHLWYLLAQFCSGIVIAITGYIAYKHVVFKQDPASLEP